MSVINNGILLASEAAAAGPFEISRSLRFNSADSAYLNRTPGSAGNRNTWTFSCWLKLGAKLLDGTSNFVVFTDSGYNTGLHIRRAGVSNPLAIEFFSVDGATVYLDLFTAQVFRDPSAWYHLVFFFDLSNATQADRAQIFINGQRITSFASTTNTISTSSSGRHINDTVSHYIGRGSTQYADGYLADVHFIDGQALTPTSFGEFDATTGVWNPIEYTGSYGTNGFHLTFSDNSGTTSTTLGKDAAGSNNWTPTNFSVAAGSGNDSLVDVPQNGDQTDTGVGGEVRGNYATLNPLSNNASQTTLSNGNLQAVGGGGAASSRCNSTTAVSSGKWYFEAIFAASGTNGGYSEVGIGQNFITNQEPGQDASSYAYLLGIGSKYNNSSLVSYGSALSVGDVFMCAFDLDNSKVFFGKNGTWFDSGNPASGTNPAYTISSGTYTPVTRPYASSGTSQVDFNFGQRAFAYTAPSGFKALCTANLPTPTIEDGSAYMDVKLYTGNGSSQSITGLAFSPDFVWLKDRTSANDHNLYDIIRGTNKKLVSNSTAAEASVTDVFNSFDSTGFSIGNSGQINTNNNAYAAWCWDAGSSTVSNTQGSITSSVRANASAGFSIVTWSVGTAVNNSTIGHNLGTAPSLIICKTRTNSNQNWIVYHKTLGTGDYLALESTQGSDTRFSTIWGTSAPTSTVFGVGLTGYSNNTSNNNYVAYCFAPVAGYSAFGSYTGNGSSDGPFVYTGHRSRWILIKVSSTTGSWVILDTARNTYNIVDQVGLRPNVSDADSTDPVVDIVSNGFKMRKGTASLFNSSGATYVWAAFAENPFKYSRAR